MIKLTETLIRVMHKISTWLVGISGDYIPVRPTKNIDCKRVTVIFIPAVSTLY